MKRLKAANNSQFPKSLLELLNSVISHLLRTGVHATRGNTIGEESIKPHVIQILHST